MSWLPLLILANIDLDTTTPFMNNDSFGQHAGKITMTINGNDFYEASPDTPVFLRFRLDKNTRLAETLVDVETALRRNTPINLAMSLLSTDDSKLRAPSHSLSIVRWQRGEGEFWLRVLTSSNLWVESPQGKLSPPDLYHRVQWTLGQSVDLDMAHNEPLYALGKANLEANYRQDEAVPTFLILDTSYSYLESFPDLNAKQRFDTIAFNYLTTGVLTEEFSTGIRLGDATSANFNGSDTVAIGIEESRPFFFWQNAYLKPVLRVFNPTSEQKPVVVVGRLSVSVCVTYPGSNLFSLEDIVSSEPWISLEEADEVIAQFAFQNVSGQVFSLQESQLGAEQTYLLHAGSRGEATINLANWNPESAQVVVETVTESGEINTVMELSLALIRMVHVPLDVHLTEEPTLIRLRSTQAILASVTQQYGDGEGKGWVRNIAPLPKLTEEVTF